MIKTNTYLPGTVLPPYIYSVNKNFKISEDDGTIKVNFDGLQCIHE